MTHTTVCNLVAGVVLALLLVGELADRCHRCWVAAALRYVGWRVETDFEEEG